MNRGYEVGLWSLPLLISQTCIICSTLLDHHGVLWPSLRTWLWSIMSLAQHPIHESLSGMTMQGLFISKEILMFSIASVPLARYQAEQ